MKKRIVSLLLAACVLFAVASCDEVRNEEPETETEQTAYQYAPPCYIKENAILCDVTGDGVDDICYSVTTGSGMVRTQCRIEDGDSDELYVLDGYDYDYFVTGAEDGRLIVMESGPNGYGEPVVQRYGTVEVQDGILVFVADD